MLTITDPVELRIIHLALDTWHHDMNATIGVHTALSIEQDDPCSDVFEPGTFTPRNEDEVEAQVIDLLNRVNDATFQEEPS